MPVPDFSPGEVLTAAAMDSIGLWLVKTQTIGTAVSSVTVSDAFDANFDNYKIIIAGGVASGALAGILLTLGSTNTGYYYGGYTMQYTGATLGAAPASNISAFQIGYATPNALSASVELQSPNLAKNTMIQAEGAGAGTTSFAMKFGGYVNNTTQYTAFTITASTGTFTGGTIRVYGYRN